MFKKSGWIIIPCNNSICLVCVYDLIEKFILNCSCGRVITKILYYGLLEVEKPRLIVEDNFIVILRVLFTIATNNFTPGITLGYLGTYLLRLECRRLNTYNFRTRSVRRYCFYIFFLNNMKKSEICSFSLQTNVAKCRHERIIPPLVVRKFRN